MAGATFGVFAEAWLAAQTSDASTREAVASRLKVHLLPTFGDLELRAIRPSAVQAWFRGRQQRLAPSSVRVLLANLSSILGAAVEDGLIPSSPCQARSVKAPPVERKRVVPWSGDRVEAVVAEHPERSGTRRVQPPADGRMGGSRRAPGPRDSEPNSIIARSVALGTR